MLSLPAQREPKMPPCFHSSTDCCNSGLRIDPSTSNPDPDSSAYTSDPVAQSVALPTAPLALPIVDCLPSTPDTASDPYHTDDDTPNTLAHRSSDPRATTKRNCYKDHDKPPPDDTNKGYTHSTSVSASFESPPCQAHKPCAYMNGSMASSPAALRHDKNHPAPAVDFANPCIL